MDVFLQIAGLCSLSLFLAWRLVPPLTAPFLAISYTALFHIAFALAYLYTQGKVALLAFSLFLGCYTFIRLLRTDRMRLAEIAKPILIFGLLLCFFVWHYANARVVYWDEFFWAGFVKHLVLENGLWNWGSVLPRKDSVLLYPPATTILQAMFQPLRHFSESRIAVAESAVLLSACGIVLHVGLPRIKGRLEQCCLVLGCFVILRSLGTLVKHYSYLFAYSEALQLAIYTSLVLMAFFEFREIKKRLLLWSGSLLLLVLCKPTGFVLSGFSVGTIALVQLLNSGNNDSNTGFGEKLKRGFLPSLKIGLKLFVPCVLLWFCWQIYVEHVVLGSMQSHFANMGNPSLAANLPVVLNTYIESFFVKSFLSVPYIWHGKYISTNFTIFLGIGAMLWFAHSHTRPYPGNHIVFAYFLLTWLVWAALHGYALLRYTSVQEQMYAASFERYVAVALGPALLIACVLFLQAASLHGKRILQRFLQLCLALMVVHAIIFAFMRPHGLPAHIADMHAAATFLQKNIPSDSTYLLVTGNPKYELNNACQFYVMPDLREAYVESSGSFNPHTTRLVKLSGGDFSDNFRELVQKYNIDFLLIWHCDHDFMVQVGPLLGLEPTSKTPILLNLKAWRAGAEVIPQKIQPKENTVINSLVGTNDAAFQQ